MSGKSEPVGPRRRRRRIQTLPRRLLQSAGRRADAPRLAAVLPTDPAVPTRDSTLAPAPAPPQAAGGGDSPLALHGGLLAVQLLFSSVPRRRQVRPGGPPLALASLRVGFVTPVLLVLAWRHDRSCRRCATCPSWPCSAPSASSATR